MGVRHTFKSLLSGVQVKWCLQLTIDNSGTTTKSVTIQYHSWQSKNTKIYKAKV